LIGLTTANY
jgi:hypothetical protein